MVTVARGERKVYRVKEGREAPGSIVVNSWATTASRGLPDITDEKEVARNGEAGEERDALRKLPAAVPAAEDVHDGGQEDGQWDAAGEQRRGRPRS